VDRRAAPVVNHRPPEQIERDIDDASETRSAMQRAGVRGRAADTAKKIDGLYAELREAKAAIRHGTREIIARQARIERELEKVSRSKA
jgi:hypothetical protein